MPSRAVGDKWAGHSGPALTLKSPSRLLCVLCGFAVTSSVFASTTWTGPTWNVSTAIPDNGDACDFIGLDPTGNWTLFVADQSVGETSTLQSWSLTMTGVPEPSSTLLVLFSGSLWLTRRRRV